MPNFSKSSLTRVGRTLGVEDGGAPLARLVAWSRIPRKTLYNWTLSAEDPQYRTMPPMAKRLVAILAYFAMSGQLTPHRLRDIEALEMALEDEQTLQKLARRMSRVLAGLNLLPASKAASGPEPANGAEEGDEELLAAFAAADLSTEDDDLAEEIKRRTKRVKERKDVTAVP
jgi:hypothetical protein